MFIKNGAHMYCKSNDVGWVWNVSGNSGLKRKIYERTRLGKRAPFLHVQDHLATFK